MKKIATWAALWACAQGSFASAQHVMIPDNFTFKIMLFSAHDGSLLDPEFIDLNLSTGTAPEKPNEIIRAPNGDLLISDDVAGVIFRFSSDGSTYLGESAMGIDRCRALEWFGGFLWVANEGTNNGSPGPGLVQLDDNFQTIRTIDGVGRPFDIANFTYQGIDGLIVSDAGAHELWFVDPTAPTLPPIPFYNDPVGDLHVPRQICVKSSDGNVLVAGAGNDGGVYEYDKDTGQQVQYYDLASVGGPAQATGVFELGNGHIMMTRGFAVYSFDPATLAVREIIFGVNTRYISEVTAHKDTFEFCDPAVNNSTGMPVLLSANQSSGGLHLEATGGPPGQFGYMLFSTDLRYPNYPILGVGRLCLGPNPSTPIGRYNIAGTPMNSIGTFNATGRFENLSNTSTVGTGFDVPSTLPIAGLPMVSSGQAMYFQLWYRDSGSSNLSNGASALY